MKLHYLLPAILFCSCTAKMKVPLALNIGTSLSRVAKNAVDSKSTTSSFETDVRLHPNHNYLGLVYVYVSSIYSTTHTSLLDVRTPDAPTVVNTLNRQIDYGIGFSTSWWSYRELPRLFPVVDGWMSFTRTPRCNFNALLGYTTKSRNFSVQGGFTLQGTGAGPLCRVSYLIGGQKKHKHHK